MKTRLRRGGKERWRWKFWRKAVLMRDLRTNEWQGRSGGWKSFTINDKIASTMLWCVLISYSLSPPPPSLHRNRTDICEIHQPDHGGICNLYFWAVECRRPAKLEFGTMDKRDLFLNTWQENTLAIGTNLAYVGLTYLRAGGGGLR